MAEESNGTHNPEDAGVPDTWRVVELGALGLRIHGGGTPSTKNPAYWGGVIPWTTSAYIDDRLYLDRCAGFTTPEGLSNSSSQLVPKGNVLVGTRVGVGKVAINAIDTAISQDLTAIIVDSEQTCSEFLAYSIKSDAIQKAILSASRGTTIKGIPRADLIRIPIPLPPLPEQRRIGAVLNAIQEAIAAQEDVIAAARHFKRSLMQRLFTYGPGREPAETKETEIGEIPALWEVVELGNLAEFKNGINFSADQKGSGTLTVDVLNMYGGYLAVRMDNLYRVSIKTNDNSLLKMGDVLIVRSSLKQEGVGWPALFSGYREPVSYCGFLIRARIKTDSILPAFLVNYLRLPAVRQLLISKSGKVAITNVSQGSLSNLPVGLPSIFEQETITDALEALDAKIAAEEDRKTALEALFKSMLHQLMTGQIRLLTDEGVRFAA